MDAGPRCTFRPSDGLSVSVLVHWVPYVSTSRCGVQSGVWGGLVAGPSRPLMFP